VAILDQFFQGGNFTVADPTDTTHTLEFTGGVPDGFRSD
jgi:hypothetical protein